MLTILAAAVVDHHATGDLNAIKVDGLEIATWIVMAVAVGGLIWTGIRGFMEQRKRKDD